jgi:surfactin synthase thioesterase subunit
MPRRARLADENFVVWGCENPRLRAFLFPQIGGGVSQFTAIVNKLEPWIEPWLLRLPGNEGRLQEKPISTWNNLVDYVVNSISAHATADYLLFGNCVGSLLALDVAVRLEQLGNPPELLVVCNHSVPDESVSIKSRTLVTADSERFWQELAGRGWIPPQVLQNTEVRAVLEPGLRAACQTLATYGHPDRDKPVLNCGLAAIANGLRAQRPELHGWASFTNGWYLEKFLDGSGQILADPGLPGSINDIASFALAGATPVIGTAPAV